MKSTIVNFFLVLAVLTPLFFCMVQLSYFIRLSNEIIFKSIDFQLVCWLVGFGLFVIICCLTVFSKDIDLCFGLFAVISLINQLIAAFPFIF